jgi:hemerythrin-like metal-binding protein/PAS domain S-box-containing protein
MKRIAQVLVKRRLAAWLLVLLAGLATGLLMGLVSHDWFVRERLGALETHAERRGIELMAQTLQGAQMGAIGLIGLLDDNAKQEARNARAPGSTEAVRLMENIARAHDADGTYIVGRDGIIKSSWGVGRPLTGVDVNFRPYFRGAIRGKENVYAAVGTTTGRRNLYFAVPLHAGNSRQDPIIGAVVMRMGVTRLDELVARAADIALLLSPQGVVYAASRQEWIGHLASAPTPEQLKTIRDLKQFGNMFEGGDPQVLPLDTASGYREFAGKRYAVASAAVDWNDPSGTWKLVLFEDLGRSVTTKMPLWVGLGSALLFLLFGGLLLNRLRDRYAKEQAGEELAAYARAQENGAERKSRLAEMAMRLQQADSITALGRTFLAEAHATLGALQGALYVADSAAEGPLRLAASFACDTAPPQEIARGEGLLGQCAVERRVQLIETAPAGFAMIRSGLGDATPTAILIAPILLQDALLGIVEVALLQQPEAAERELFEEMTALLALNLEIVRRNTQAAALLSATLEAKQASVEQLAFQQTLIDTIPYPLFFKGADTRFLGFNRAYEETFGVHREDLIGKRVLDLEYLPEADRIAYQAEDEATIASAGKVRHEMQIPFADGKLHDTLYFVSGFRRKDGSPGGLVGTFMDISQVKNAERELERLADAEQFSRLALGREERIVALKEEVNALCARLGEPLRYASAELAGQGEDAHETQAKGGKYPLVRLIWHPAYECGQPDIDRDHRGLFADANELLNALLSGSAPEKTGEIVNKLAEDVVAHFAREEALIASRGYADADGHARIHQELLGEAVRLIERFKAGEVEAGQFFQFLAHEVIAKHMLQEDRRFIHLFKPGVPGAETIAAAAAPAQVPGLSELVALDELQELISNFCESVGIAAAIIDLKGQVLAAARWQRVCTDFHRVNPESCARCIESDTELALRLQEGQDFTIYTCKNGMTDAASPIVVEGQHLANVFIGQFHLGPPDLEFFREQARRYGYPEADYLKAVSEAPLLDERRLPAILGFLTGFSRLVATMSLARLRADQTQEQLKQQAEQLRRERIAAMSLAEDAARSRPDNVQRNTEQAR